ncbi:MAG: ribose-5-phosphate isomerase RpiA [Hyphomicrobium sp.]|uniref:ribose-5-phosphate isomerase RpiA n=1 Tax=Hyphomicrobium sp. TaxID=82 RepID=UPI00132B13CE|nr:ribose-5-phosphate isomerase RpiA [Hyphomicrobium sp.]KAB2940816.1 MAG: ribose-5-phosphate isomerase RpiA [Hyphomicrobium sp.]MBZ0209839.1 ribose-5-phosphate isomerase RpiA [Hyphomicrobium sp.]MCZ7595351.1 ribose-5-phosphate isomerase RpiA [Hyphomicrobium sp.]
MSQDALKVAAAERALEFVENGMRLGLGTGSTAAKFVDLLGKRVAGGLDVTCVATSHATQAQAEGLGIRMSTLDETPFLDLTVDGADEIDGELRLIKGGGGALLREKIVATASGRMIVIADASKKVETLGAFPLPLEVVPFGLTATRNMITALAADVGCEGDLRVRMLPGGKPFLTDGGNLLLDCHFGRIEAPEELDEALKLIPGVVENGLFIGIADLAIIAGEGGITLLGVEDSEGAIVR